MNDSARARVRIDVSAALANGSNYAEFVEWGTWRSVALIAFDKRTNEVFVTLSPGKYQFLTTMSARACGRSTSSCLERNAVANASIDLSIAEDPEVAPAFPRMGPWLLLGTLCVAILFASAVPGRVPA